MYLFGVASELEQALVYGKLGSGIDDPLPGGAEAGGQHLKVSGEGSYDGGVPFFGHREIGAFVWYTLELLLQTHLPPTLEEDELETQDNFELLWGDWLSEISVVLTLDLSLSDSAVHLLRGLGGNVLEDGRVVNSEEHSLVVTNWITEGMSTGGGTDNV